MTNQLVRLAAATTAGMLLMAGCTNDKPEKIPDVPTTSTPSVSPAPKPPTLSSAEKKAYDKAVKDYAEARKIIDRLSADPKQGMKDIDDLRDIAFSPAINSMAKEIREYSEKNVHIEGSRNAAWQVPNSVDLDTKIPTIVWQQCNTPGDFKVFRDDKEIPQKRTNRLLRIKSNPSKDFFWRITKIEEVGTC